MRFVVSMVIGCLIAACSSAPRPADYRPRGANIAEVLADLPELSLPAQSAPHKPTRAEVMAAYNRVYGRLNEPRENHAIGKRLADLEMAQGEDRDIEGQPQPYNVAIARYESLLEAPEGVALDQILYQLARAYDLSQEGGKSLAMLDRLIGEYPHSAYVPEARFRRAEMHFSAGRFALAAADYEEVVAVGDETPYLKNARYMLGWSQFKQSNLEDGLTAFFAVIDDVLSTEAPLPQTEQELLDDSFRAVVLALQYLDGAETLAARMEMLERPKWQLLAYEKLAEDYRLKERYLDTVRTWEMFVAENALDAQAPEAQKRVIETLIEGDFPSEVGAKKEEYVARFGIYSPFYAAHNDDVKAAYRPTLHAYLGDLSRDAHAEAQALASEKDEKRRKPEQARLRYLAAAGWYEEFLETFPDDAAVPERLFLLGEVYTEAAEPVRAVSAYQRVVREHTDYHKAPEAGYAAILGLGQAMEGAAEHEGEVFKLLQIAAQIEFALLFPGDERAPAVQVAAADSLFQLGRFGEAVDLAADIVANVADATPDVRRAALLIQGHGQFELGSFAAAETAYQTLLTLLEEPERVPVRERMLAAVFKQGEQAEAEGAADSAVHHYLRISTLDAESELAVRGHFDAIAVVEAAGDAARAAELLEDLRERYPEHELSRDAGLRLASLYEATESWSLAARELAGLSTSETDPEVRRQSRYRAAELYLQVEDLPAATQQFTAYVATFKEPADIRFEAMQHLDQLAERQNDAQQQRRWKEEKIDLHRKLGKSATERMTYIAAHDSYGFAVEELEQFDAIRLTHPLKQSLKRKQKALSQTVRAFEAVADYKVQELATAATFHIADMYTRLGRSILQSDRPQGLSELEMEQYDILLEEQAYPFEEQAISLHEINMRRSWEGVYDDWVRKSFEALSRLMPSRFDKQEVEIAYVEVIH